MKKVSLATLNKRIEKSNAEFETMTLPQKRVAVAKDLIARILLEQISATQDDGIVSFYPYTGDGNSIKSILETSQTKVCNVCAKGGLLMAYVGRVNQMTITDIQETKSNDSYYCFNPDSLPH